MVAAFIANFWFRKCQRGYIGMFEFNLPKHKGHELTVKCMYIYREIYIYIDRPYHREESSLLAEGGHAINDLEKPMYRGIGETARLHGVDTARGRLPMWNEHQV